jgi:hypothetical protein
MIRPTLAPLTLTLPCMIRRSAARQHALKLI